jgi:GNAT superfamily N-acetyltransferase
MTEILTYTNADLPETLKWQIVSFMRVVWTDGFNGANRPRDWITRDERHPVHVVLVENDMLISYTGVVWQMLEHEGETYKVYGLSGVFTYPDYQGEGYGRQTVEAATALIRESDADVALLWCEPENRGFYQKCGWAYVEGGQTVLTNEDGKMMLFGERMMMLFLSDKGQQGRQAFETKPVYFGAESW